MPSVARQRAAADDNIPGADALTTELDEIGGSGSGAGSRADLAYESLNLMRSATIADGSRAPKLVVFFSDSESAQLLQKRFDKPAEVALFAEGSFEALDRFENDPRMWLLIADASGEEGLNLHFAHGILHGDLPFSATRIEQRIGRLDRFGRKIVGIRQRVILPYDEDDSVWAAWLRVLVEGFQIFDRSISDVQFVLSQLEDELALAVHGRGASGLTDAIGSLQVRLADERLRQDEQYALDQMAMSEEPAEQLIECIKNSEADEEGLQRDMEGWILDVMRLRRSPVAWPETDPFLLRWTDGTHVPKEPWQAEFGSDLNRPLTWRRRVATGNKAVSLLRQGTPLVDACERYMRWDDRGTTFATWRVWPEWFGSDNIFAAFRLCFIIEPDVPEDETVLTRGRFEGLRRRAHGYLRPWTRTLHVDTSGEVITDERLLKLLEARYGKQPAADGRYDRNLGNRLASLYEVIDRDGFERLCYSVRIRQRAYLWVIKRSSP